MKKHQKESINRIVNEYPYENQREIFVEECAEAIQAVQKMKRAENSTEYAERCENFIEEIADVIIMTEQMKRFIDSEVVDKIVEYKITRQLIRIEEERKNTDGSERVFEEI